MNLLTQTLAAGALALSLLGAATAAPVTRNFTVTIDFSAAPAVVVGDVFSGSFSYDDAVFTTDVNFPGQQFHALSTFQFSFRNVSYTQANLNYGSAIVQGGSFYGLDVSGPGFSFLLDANGPYFGFTVNGRDGTGVVSSTVRPVPAPATALLSVLALAALGAFAPRRQAARRSA